MLKKTKKILTLILALSVVMSMLCSTAFAEQGGSANNEPYNNAGDNNPYVYYFNWYQYNVSPHQLSVTLTKDNTTSQLRDNIWLWIFRLDYKDGETFEDGSGNAKEGAAIAYCCDERTDIDDGVGYKRINLEDSTYYNEDTARKIRAIFDYGYWPDKSLNEKLTDKDGNQIYKEIETVKLDDNDNIITNDANQVEYEKTKIDKTRLHKWLEETEESVNKWLNESGKDKRIKNLTAAEALTATQAAIWNYANKDDSEKYEYSYTYTSDYYKKGMNGTSEDKVVHPFDYELEWKLYKDPKHSTEDNVNLFIEYLMAKSESGKESSKIVFSDKYFVTSEITLADEKNDVNNTTTPTYTVTVKFKLSGTIGSDDNLTLTANLGNKTITKSLPAEIGALNKDSEGFYTIKFDGVNEAEMKEKVTMTVSGTQIIDDVYFYQPLTKDEASETSSDANGGTTTDPVRKASQNLVGKAKGETKVFAQKSIDIGNKAELTKYDESTAYDEDSVETTITVEGVNRKVLAGAKFNLYVKIEDGNYILVKEGLVTDENGKITVKGLTNDYDQDDTPKYDYYFKETKAPEGYNLDSRYYPIVWKTTATDGSVTTGEFIEKEFEKNPNEVGSVAVGNTKYTGHVHYDSTLVGGDAVEASWTLTGSKTLDGKPCGGYSFTMLDKDGTELATVKSDASGVITFPTQTYKEEGTYTYRIFEVEGDGDVVYDDAVYTVSVNVTKTGDKLTAAATVYENNDKVEQIVFENKTDTANGENNEENGNDIGDKGTGNKDNTSVNAEKTEVPKTGDMFILWAAAAILSAAALVCIYVAERRKQRQ